MEFEFSFNVFFFIPRSMAKEKYLETILNKMDLHSENSLQTERVGQYMDFSHEKCIVI